MDRKILLLAVLISAMMLSGCLQSPKNFTCCLKTNASKDPAACVMFNSTDPNTPLDLSSVTNSCNTTAGTCNITTKLASFSGFPFPTSTPAEYTTVQICTEMQPQQCINPLCRAMVCGDFEYRPRIPSYVADVEKAIPEKQDSGAINLYHGQCQFLPMDFKLASIMSGSQTYLSRFRIGLGTDFNEYAQFSTFFPVSDKFCNINPRGTIDRYQNYLITEDKKYDPINEINKSCVSDQDPSEAPLPFRLGSLNPGPNGEQITGYKFANYIRQVGFWGDTDVSYMTPYQLPDPKFYTKELQKRYMDEAYNFTMWVIHVNDKLKDASVSMGYMDPACVPCAGMCSEIPACYNAPIYQAKCKSDWDRYDLYLANKAKAEAEVTKAVGEKPKAAPKALYECDPGNPTECLSSKCSTEHYSRVNLFVSGQEVAMPCSHSTIQAVNYTGIHYASGEEDGKVLWTTPLYEVKIAPYATYDVLTCEPTTDITFDTPGSSVATHHIAQADYKQPGSDSYTTANAQDIILFSYDKSRYPADHVEVGTGDLTGTDNGNICSAGFNCAGVYGADYVATGHQVVGYSVMNGEDFPHTLFARLCQLEEGTDYEVVDVSNSTVCGRRPFAPIGSCLVGKEKLSDLFVNQCYLTQTCVNDDGSNLNGVGAFFFDAACYIYNSGSCYQTMISPTLADSYNGLARTFGSSALYNGLFQDWSDFPEEIMPQFLKDLKALHPNHKFMCLAPDAGNINPNYDQVADCMADVPNAPRQIVLIKGLGACDYELKPGPFPKIKEYGWCESCSLATMAYQTVQRRDVPYIPYNEVGYTSLDGSTHTYKSGDGKMGPQVYSGDQLLDNYTSKQICTWDDKNSVMKCNSSRDFEPYHNQNPLNIQSPQEEPEATYLKTQMARFLQSGTIPILDMVSNSDWDPILATVNVPESGFQAKCTASAKSSAELQCSFPIGIVTAYGNDKEACINDLVKNAGCDGVPDTQTVQKQVNEYMATRLINNMGAIIVVVESTERGDAQTMRDNIKSRSQIIKKECPRCLTALKVTGYDNVTFQNNIYKAFGGFDCFGSLANPAGGQCDMQIADDPLFGVDVIIFDYGVQNNSDAYKDAKNPKEKADAVISNMQSWGYYNLLNYHKPSIIYDFYVSQKDPSGLTNDPKAWTPDEVSQLFTEMITREDELVKSGITGVFYARVKTVPFPAYEKDTELNWTKLVSMPDEYKHNSMCSLSEAMTRMVADKPMTFFQRRYTSSTVACTPCSYSEMYAGTCSKTCADGVECTPEPDATALSSLKCPDGGIPEPCKPCNETGKTFTCTVEYDNGTILTQDVKSGDITGDAYADVISGINAPDKCCISKGGVNYTYTQQSTTLSINSPIVYSKSGDTKVDCSFPSASQTNPGDSQFCNVKSGASNYRVSCIEKGTYSTLQHNGAFAGGFVFGKNYQLITSGGSGPAQIISTGIGGVSVTPQVGNTFNSYGMGGSIIISAGGGATIPGFGDPCLQSTTSGPGSSGSSGSSGTSGGAVIIQNPSIGGSKSTGTPSQILIGGTGTSGSTGVSSSAVECQGPKYACALEANKFEKDAEKKCADYKTLCEAQPWAYTSIGIYQYCDSESACKSSFETYCSNVRKKYGKTDLECEISCCKNKCQFKICAPDPRDLTKKLDPSCVPHDCPDPCEERDLACENTCKGGAGGVDPASIVLDPPYPWAPGGSKAGQCGDPCGLISQCGPK